MTLAKAIKTLEKEALEEGFYLSDYIDALKLGIEALKARKIWQDEEGFDPGEALPGETEERF